MDPELEELAEEVEELLVPDGAFDRANSTRLKMLDGALAAAQVTKLYTLLYYTSTTRLRPRQLDGAIAAAQACIVLHTVVYTRPLLYNTILYRANHALSTPYPRLIHAHSYSILSLTPHPRPSSTPFAAALTPQWRG